LQDSNPELQASLARADLENAPVSEAERSLLRFVKLVTETAYRTTDADVEILRGHGWTDPQIAECVYITGLFAFFNRVADAFGIEDPRYFDHPPPQGGERVESPPASEGQE
jgi:alkylhydroperoxidase family enzyme